MTKTEVTKSGIAEIGAATNLLISMTAIAPVAYHFVELAEIPPNNFRTLAILDETVRVSNYLSSIANDVAKFDPEPTTSTAIAIISASLALLNGGVQIAESITAD